MQRTEQSAFMIGGVCKFDYAQKAARKRGEIWNSIKKSL